MSPERVAESFLSPTTEFGVRMAVGASAPQVLRMVLAREARLIGAAMVAGAVGTVFVTRAMFAELVTVTTLSPMLPALLLARCAAVPMTAVRLATYGILRLEPSAILRQG